MTFSDWRIWVLLPRPLACEGSALPFELISPSVCSVMFSMSFIPLQDLCHLEKHLFVFCVDIKEGCTFAIDAKAEP